MSNKVCEVTFFLVGVHLQNNDSKNIKLAKASLPFLLHLTSTMMMFAFKVRFELTTIGDISRNFSLIFLSCGL